MWVFWILGSFVPCVFLEGLYSDDFLCGLCDYSVYSPELPCKLRNRISDCFLDMPVWIFLQHSILKMTSTDHTTFSVEQASPL